VTGCGYQNVITIDLVDDPMLTEDNIRYFKKISKELYDDTVVRHDYSSSSYVVELLVLISPLM
jgi:hypothetical protein